MEKRLLSVLFIVAPMAFMSLCFSSCEDNFVKVDRTETKEESKKKYSVENITVEHPQQVRGFMVQSAHTLSKSTLVDAKAWGINVIRLQLNPVTYALAQNKDFWDALPDYTEIVKTKVLEAKEVGVKVVLDLHEPPFLVNGKVPSSTYQGTDEFWNQTGLKGNFIRMWEAIALALSDDVYNDAVWGYDLFNEPQINWSAAPQQWISMSPDIIAAIRAIDKDVWIVYQPGGNTSTFNTLQPLEDSRVVYSVHFYAPHSFTHQGIETAYSSATMTRGEAMEQINKQYPGIINGRYWDKQVLEANLRPFSDFVEKHQVPGYIGEFSVVTWAPVTSSVAWLTDAIQIFEEHNFSWCYHAFREWQGWSLEQPEGAEAFWFQRESIPAPATEETERGKVVKAALGRNNQTSTGITPVLK